MGGDNGSLSVSSGRDRMAAKIHMAEQLLCSASGGIGQLTDAVEVVRQVKQTLAALGGDENTPVSIAAQLLAARDDLGALLRSIFILEEVGVAEPVTWELLRRGVDKCSPRLHEIGLSCRAHPVAEPVG